MRSVPFDSVQHALHWHRSNFLRLRRQGLSVIDEMKLEEAAIRQIALQNKVDLRVNDFLSGKSLDSCVENLEDFK